MNWDSSVTDTNVSDLGHCGSIPLKGNTNIKYHAMKMYDRMKA
jgi:hypothetical protein